MKIDNPHTAQIMIRPITNKGELMSHLVRYAAAWFGVLLLAGCAAPTTMRMTVSDSATKAEQFKQMELAAQDMVNEEKRLARVYQKITTKATSFCGDNIGPVSGVRSLTKGKGDMADAMARLYGIKEQPTVLFTLDNGPAEKAGVKPRDVILRINGVETSDRSGIESMYSKVLPTDPIKMIVSRDGIDMNIDVHPVVGCRYSASVSPDQVVNAYADGKSIVVTRGMMNFARDDNELALVISHELAHNTMKHIDAKKKNVGLGALADIAAILLTRGQVKNTNFAQAAGQAYSQDFEAEADYVGLYIMANAELPITDAPNFWRRMAAANPGNIKTNHAASHPSTAYRMVALEKTVKEIEEKVAKKEPLVPNMKVSSN